MDKRVLSKQYKGGNREPAPQISMDRPEIAPKGSEEIKIVLEPRYQCTTFIGTRLQIESEGLIPKGIEWPRGMARVQWNDGAFRFMLHRSRPDGFKGPRCGWADCDHWSLSRIWTRSPSCQESEIRSKTRELRELLYRETPEWKEEFNRQLSKIFAMQEDEKFQAFKNLLLDVILPPRKPRASRPRSSTDDQANQA